MDEALHRVNLTHTNSSTIRRMYGTLVDELGAGFMLSRPYSHGHIQHVLRFSRGTLNPIDFIVNVSDLRCYFRAPLFSVHPDLSALVETAFPQGTWQEKQWVFNIHDVKTCRQLIDFVNGRLRGFIESRPGGPAQPVVERLSVKLVEPDSVEGSVYWEGDRARALHEQVERNSAAREACLRKQGARCVVCDLRLRDRYAGLSREVVEVHHLRPLSNTIGPYQLDPATDLVPICPNCHRVIHSQMPALEPGQVKAMLAP